MIRAALLFCLACQGAEAAGLVAARAIPARSVIVVEDLRQVELTHPGGVTDPAEILGLEARVAVYEGRPIRRADFGPPALVERNEQVRLRFSKGRLAISANGRALDRGAVGDRVRVMNLVSRKTVIGTVTETGEVEVSQ